MSNKSKLKVFDIEELRTFETIPRNVGGVRDFNRIDMEGYQPDALESEMSQFEGVAGPALNRVDQTSEFDGDHRDAILTLMAMIAVRTPHMREHMRKVQAELMDRVLGISLVSKERWESQVRRMRDAGYENQKDVSYEQIRAFHESKDYRIDFAREYHIAMEFLGVDAILPFLHTRYWTLIKAPDDSPFITCDQPMMLTWKDVTKVPPIVRDNPGYGMGNTQVYFPLSKRHALIGEFDGREGILEANSQLVSYCNSKALVLARKQLYSPSSLFEIRGLDGEVVRGDRLLKYVENHRHG